MRELLERWARLEPERCMSGPPTTHICVSVRVGDDTHAVMLDRPSAKQQALLLAAAIEAIEARGWSFEARHLLGHSEASVEVRPAQSLLVWPPYKATADTFTQALLGAHLAALEAEGEQ